MPSSPASAIQGDVGIAYFESLQDCLERAAVAAGGFVDRELDVAGIRVLVRCAGRAMHDALLPPFEHLAVEPSGDADLTIGLFDSASTGVAPPVQPWPALPVGPGENPVARLEAGRVSILAAAGTGALSAAEPGTGTAIYHLPDAAAVPPSERAAPLREPLHLLIGRRGRWLAHAGAAGRDGAGALIVGRSGSGKSTLALSCARVGMEVVADDYVVLEPGPPTLAHALQSTAKLTEDSAERLGISLAEVDPAGFEATFEGPAKAMVEIDAIAPGSLRRLLALRALIAPTVAGLSKPSLEPISPARGLQALAPSTVMQARAESSGLLAALAALVREVPSFALHLSPDPKANAAAVAEAVSGDR